MSWGPPGSAEQIQGPEQLAWGLVMVFDVGVGVFYGPGPTRPRQSEADGQAMATARGPWGLQGPRERASQD